MKKWLKRLLIILAIIILIVAVAGFYFYNKYSAEITELRTVRNQAGELFRSGIVGPNKCNDYLGCIRYCEANQEECVSFCQENPDNGICLLAKDYLGI